jgi:hypothetical protein
VTVCVPTVCVVLIPGGSRCEVLLFGGANSWGSHCEVFICLHCAVPTARLNAVCIVPTVLYPQADRVTFLSVDF